MAKNINSLQLLRSNRVYPTKEAAVNALKTLVSQDGVAALARYSAGTDVVKTIVGFNYVEAGGTATGTSWTIMDFDSAQIAAMQTEINTIESGVGLSNTGEYIHTTGANYTDSATTVVGAIDALDEAIKANADAIDAMDATSVSGDSKVVIDVTQENGQITASAANLTGVKLDGYTVGADDSAKVAAADTLGQALGKLQGQINGMDLPAVGQAGSVITGVAEADGKVSASATPLVDITLTGFESGATEGDIAANDTVETALNKLQNNIKASASATSVKNTDGSINVTLPTGSETGTTIDVNIKSGEKVLAKDGGNGLYTDIKLSAVTTSSTAVKEEYALIGNDGTALGDHIKIYKDSHIVSITYITDSGDTHYQHLKYEYVDASGNTQTEYVDISSLVLEAEFASGVTATNHVVHGVVDPTSEKDSNNDSFLTVGADGFKIDGIKDEINAKIAALDVTGDTAVAGQYVAAIEEANGVVAVKTRANVSDAVLTGYAKGTKPASTALAATDDVKGALAKLEHQIDDAKAAATTKVVEGTDEGNNMTITSATSETDGSVTYTIDLVDVASASALTQEIADRKTADTELSNRLGTGVTTANTATEQFAALSGNAQSTSAQTSVEGAKRYADEKVADVVSNLDATVTGATSGNHVTISIEELDGKLVQSGLTIEENDIASAAALEAEITARKAVDGQNGQTYTANANANYISGALSLNDADVKLDAALADLADTVSQMTSGAVQTIEVNDVEVPESTGGTVNLSIAAVNSAANNENAIVVTTAHADTDNPGAVTLQLGTLDAGTFN